MNTDTHAGYVALIGRPNAGKSTLLNRLVGQKIAAVSDKPQTTRFRIQGVITKPEGLIVLVDTPGVHQPGYELIRRMMRRCRRHCSVSISSASFAMRLSRPATAIVLFWTSSNDPKS